MILCHTNMIIQSMLVLILRFIAETYSSGLVFSMYQLQQISSNKYNHLSDSDPTSNPESSQNQQMTINNSPSKTVICQTFSLHQRKLCHQHFRLMESVVNGFLLGLNECQFQFADQIWNCKGHNLTIGGHRTKSKPRKKGKTYLDKLVSKSTPEAAYVSSVISAGVAHQVTKACSKGVHDSCGCDRTIYDTPESERFKWSGCSHNIHFGAAFTRQFLDVPDKIRVSKKPEKALTKLHNNHVGRQAVIMKMAKKCKCHGVSGSCEMKTCIRALPDFRVVGDLLKSRFHKAMQVHFVDSRLIPRYWPSRMFTDNDLIYLLKSPNYCVHNPHFGSLGTQGRKCAESSLLEKKPEETRGSCEELCCGRGHKKRTFSRVEQCHCKFHWCCDVKCDQCRKDVIEAVCD